SRGHPPGLGAARPRERVVLARVAGSRVAPFRGDEAVDAEPVQDGVQRALGHLHSAAAQKGAQNREAVERLGPEAGEDSEFEAALAKLCVPVVGGGRAGRLALVYHIHCIAMYSVKHVSWFVKGFLWVAHPTCPDPGWLRTRTAMWLRIDSLIASAKLNG